MTRLCTVHLVLDEEGKENRYFVSLFVEDEPSGRGPFSPQSWPLLGTMFTEWGLDEADVSALKEKLDRNRHAAQKIEIENSDLIVLGFIFNPRAHAGAGSE
jgi:hypothetical protein